MALERRLISLVLFPGLLCLLSCVAGRKLITKSNPGCTFTECDSSTVLASVVMDANGSDYQPTYLYSSVGVPGMVVARTAPRENVNAKWSNNSSVPTLESVTFARNYSMTILFTRLLAMNVTDYVPGETPLYQTFDLSKSTSDSTSWFPSVATVNTSSDLSMYMSTEVDTGLANFTMTVSTSVDEGREGQLPRLKYTENSTRLEIAFNGWKDVNASDPFVLEAKNKGLNFVLEVLLVPDPQNVNAASEEPFSLHSGRSLDDEYTPSQFWHSIIQNGDGYVYWKPIVYTSRNKRNIANSVPMDTVKNHTNAFYHFHDISDEGKLPPSIASLLYGDSPAVADNAYFVYFSFNATTETAQVWSAVVGVGTPPADQISLMVILIIALGLGIPVVVLVFGVPGATIYKRYRANQRGGYTAIQ